MNLLLVEDDEHKRRHLLEFLTTSRPRDVVREARSFQSGLRSMRESTPDLVLLDMSVPTFDVTSEEDGGQPLNLGGQELLRQLEARGIFVRCVVITQFDSFGEGRSSLTAGQLDQQMKQDHPSMYFGMVTYDAASTAWKDALLAKLEELEQGEAK